MHQPTKSHTRSSKIEFTGTKERSNSMNNESRENSQHKKNLIPQDQFELGERETHTRLVTFQK